MKSWKLNEASCPHCGYKMNGATPSNEETEGAPTPGALSICINCLTVNQFADDGSGGLKIVEFDIDELEPDDRKEIDDLRRHIASFKAN